MRLLLDTHAYAWWATGDRRLSRVARDAIETPDATVLVSAAIPWEIAAKFHIGKWERGDAILADLDRALTAQRLTGLPITLPHAARAGLLPWPHRDPFDRMFAAQAEIEEAVLVTADPAFGGIAVEILW